jgi:hypothetical protein
MPLAADTASAAGVSAMKFPIECTSMRTTTASAQQPWIHAPMAMARYERANKLANAKERPESWQMVEGSAFTSRIQNYSRLAFKKSLAGAPIKHQEGNPYRAQCRTYNIRHRPPWSTLHTVATTIRIPERIHDPLQHYSEEVLAIHDN